MAEDVKGPSKRPRLVLTPNVDEGLLPNLSEDFDFDITFGLSPFELQRYDVFPDPNAFSNELDIDEQLNWNVSGSSLPAINFPTSTAGYSEDTGITSVTSKPLTEGATQSTTDAGSSTLVHNKNSMDEERDDSPRIFECPVRRAQKKLGQLPYTCRGVHAKNVAEVRRHLTRSLPGKQLPHLPFLKLCPTCNEDILDKAQMEQFHGKNGETCENPRKQRKGDAQQDQYHELYLKIKERLASGDVLISEQSTDPPVLKSLARADASHTARARKRHHEDQLFEPQIFDLSQDEDDHMDLVESDTEMEHSVQVLSEYEPPAEARNVIVNNALVSPITFTGLSRAHMQECNRSPWTVLAPLAGNISSCAVFGIAEEFRPQAYHLARTESASTSWSMATSDADTHSSLMQSTGTLLSEGNEEMYASSVQPERNTPMDHHNHLAALHTNARDRGFMIPGRPDDQTEIMHCQVPQCGAGFSGRYRKGNHARHMRMVHAENKTYRCEAPGCSNLYKRQDARLKHYRKQHPDLSFAPFQRCRKPTRTI